MFRQGMAAAWRAEIVSGACSRGIRRKIREKISMENLLEIKHMRKAFDELEVLKDISLTVKKGEVVSVIGPSGSGKSTLLRCATLLEKMDGGSLFYLGETVCKPQQGDAGDSVYVSKKELKKFHRYFGLVFQNFNLFPHYSVLKNIADAPLRVAGIPKQEAQEHARELLSQLGLEDKADAYPCQLSGGQQQRVSIARAIAAKPALLLADEPTGNLDSKTSAEVMGLLKMTSREFHQTIIMITHNEAIAQLADRVIHLEDGRIVGEQEEGFSGKEAR